MSMCTYTMLLMSEKFTILLHAIARGICVLYIRADRQAGCLIVCLFIRFFKDKETLS